MPPTLVGERVVAKRHSLIALGFNPRTIPIPNNDVAERQYAIGALPTTGSPNPPIQDARLQTRISNRTRFDASVGFRGTHLGTTASNDAVLDFRCIASQYPTWTR